jgi:hypothetical protein
MEERRQEQVIARIEGEILLGDLISDNRQAGVLEK